MSHFEKNLKWQADKGEATDIFNTFFMDRLGETYL